MSKEKETYEIIFSLNSLKEGDFLLKLLKQQVSKKVQESSGQSQEVILTLQIFITSIFSVDSFNQKVRLRY